MSSPPPSPDRDPRKWRLPDVAQLGGVKLSSLLRRLDRITAGGRERAASDPATRSYLQAGLRLLSMAVSAPMDDPASKTADPQSHPFMAWLSRSKVVDEMRNETDPSLPRRGSVGALRNRWDPQSDFVSDLLSVAVVADRWTSTVAEGAQAHLALILEQPPSTVAHEIAYQDLVQLVGSDGFRVQILAASMARNDADLGASFQTLYDNLIRSWIPIYETVFTRWNRRLRPGLTMEMFSAILAGMAEGLSLRVVETDQDQPILDRMKKTSLLGSGALAVILATTVEVGSDDDRTLEEYADQAMSSE